VCLLFEWRNPRGETLFYFFPFSFLFLSFLCLSLCLIFCPSSSSSKVRYVCVSVCVCTSQSDEGQKYSKWPVRRFFLNPKKKERKRKTKHQKRKEFLVCIRSFEGRRSGGKKKNIGFSLPFVVSLAWIFFVLVSLLSLSVCLSVWWVIFALLP